MYSKADNETQVRAMKQDILDSILNKPIPIGHSIESSTTVITNHGTVVINVYGRLEANGTVAEPDIITLRNKQSK